MIYEIVILAMVAAFLGLRLYSVLGRRAEHEEEGVTHHFEREAPEAPNDEKSAAGIAKPTIKLVQTDLPAGTEKGIRAIASADGEFDLLTFIEGAKSAYGIVLEAFWQGDQETLKALCDDDVYASFSGAIDAREKAGEVVENKLIRIEDATIKSADLDGQIARIAVLFVADIAAVTRDKDGAVIDGSLDDAIESRDVWTFMRDVRSDEPGWKLDETDEG